MPELTKEARERLATIVEQDSASDTLTDRLDADAVAAALAYIDALEAERDALKARVREAEALADAHHDDTLALKARVAELDEAGKGLLNENVDLAARVAVLAEALGNACDVAVWMSGSDDFSVGGKCREGWERARVKLYAAMAARAKTDAAGALS